MRRAILFIVALSLSTYAIGQTKPEIGELTVSNKGTNIRVDFDFNLGDAKWCELEVYLSADAGDTFFPTPLRAVSGDVGRIESSGRKQIVWDASRERHLLTGKDLVFKVSIKDAKIKEVVKSTIVLMPNLGVNPTFKDGFMSYGLMFGWAKRAGLYVKYRNNFVFQAYDIECDSKGIVPGSQYGVWTTGNTQVTRYSITGGLLGRFSKWMYIYLGGGYGDRSLLWETTGGEWARISDYSYTGVALDAGFIFRIGKFSFSLGANCTDFKYIEGELGIGVMF